MKETTSLQQPTTCPTNSTSRHGLLTSPRALREFALPRLRLLQGCRCVFECRCVITPFTALATSRPLRLDARDGSPDLAARSGAALVDEHVEPLDEKRQNVARRLRMKTSASRGDLSMAQEASITVQRQPERRQVTDAACQTQSCLRENGSTTCKPKEHRWELAGNKREAPLQQALASAACSTAAYGEPYPGAHGEPNPEAHGKPYPEACLRA